MRRRERAPGLRPQVALRSGIGVGVAVAVPATGVLMASAPALAAPGEATPTTPGTPTTGATSVRPVLYIGSRGEAVKAIQSKLGVVTTGYYGPLTQAAVKTFQAKNGLVADGVVGPLTWAKILGSAATTPSTPTKPTTGTPPTTGTTKPTTGACSVAATTLRYGTTSQLVKVLQGRLGLVVDGWFGPLTRSSVISFQAKNGLTADGVVGPLTWNKLGCTTPAGTTPTVPTVPTTPATPTVPTTPTTPTTPSTGNAATLAQVIALAKSFIGVPYVFGGSSPAGFDCSGLTSYVFSHYGVSIPRTAAQQQAYFPRTTNPKPGDLLFYGYPAYHVAIYLGDGMMIEAPHPGANVQVRSIWGTPSSYATVLK